ncbi:MAG: DUF6808 domain-containing protein [Candidatus Paceibacterota bacterium]|jgi:hypothetical protein
MKNILNYLGILLVGIIIGIVCSLIIRSKLTAPIRTVIKYDTIRITEPQSEKIIPVAVKKFTTVPTLLTISDTIKVPYYVRDTLMIPIEQKYYAGDSYKAWVSGYNPKLDSIVTFNTIQTISQIKGKDTENRLSIEARFLAATDLFLPSIGARYSRGGLFAEVGGMYHNGIKPYLQVGYSLTLFER